MKKIWVLTYEINEHYQDGYMKKDRGYQWCGGKTYIWSLV